MGGSVYFIAIVVVVFIVLAVVASPVFLIPGVVLVLVALFSAPLLAAIGRGGSSRQSAVPTTEEASYDPVAEPTERQV